LKSNDKSVIKLISTDTSRAPAVLLPVLGAPGDDAIAAQIKQFVSSAQKIVITGHERPDGDCIGSEVALCSILNEAGFNAEIVNADPTPEKYCYLAPANGTVPIRVAGPDEKLNADLVIVLDATDLNRLGRIKKEHFGAAKIIDIDHHLGNPNFGVLNWVDVKAAATAELVWRLAANNGWKVPLLAMKAIYTGLVTDTGQFAYSNTSARVLRMAAELVDRGVDPEAIWQTVYLNKGHAELALEARALASIQCAADGKVCSIALSCKDFQETSTAPHHTEDFSSIPRSVAGVVLSLFFYEINGGTQTKVSMRSTRAFDVNALARKFGGGGHKQASGCTINAPMPEARKLVVAEAERFIKEAQ
jgi:bifunctional oligoribonuclease and PAP phosphatase NrnA